MKHWLRGFAVVPLIIISALTLISAITTYIVVNEGLGGYRSRANSTNICNNVPEGFKCGTDGTNANGGSICAEQGGVANCKSGLVCHYNGLRSGICKTSVQVCSSIRTSNPAAYQKCCQRDATSTCGVNISQCIEETAGAAVCKTGLSCVIGRCIDLTLGNAVDSQCTEHSQCGAGKWCGLGTCKSCDVMTSPETCGQISESCRWNGSACVSKASTTTSLVSTVGSPNCYVDAGDKCGQLSNASLRCPDNIIQCALPNRCNAGTCSSQNGCFANAGSQCGQTANAALKCADNVIGCQTGYKCLNNRCTQVGSANPKPQAPAPGTSKTNTACSISGGTSATVGQSMSYDASCGDYGSDLTKIEIYDSPTAGAAFNHTECGASGPTSGCTRTIQWTTPGTFYVLVNGYSADSKCSGNPFGLPSDWTDCGGNDVLTVTVNPATPGTGGAPTDPGPGTGGTPGGTTGGSGAVPTCQIAGPTSVTAGTSQTYDATCTDSDGNLNKIEVYDSVTSSESWTPFKECSASGGAGGCSKTIAWSTPGTYYVIVNGYDASGKRCSGNPFQLPSGWNDCGGSDRLTVTVNAATGGTPTTITPTTGETGDVTLNFKFKFQGVTAKPRGDQSVPFKVRLKGPTNTNYANGSLTVDNNGIWNGSVSFKDIKIGSGYNILVKAGKHIQKRVCAFAPSETSGGQYNCEGNSIPLAKGVNNLDFSGVLLLVGDLPSVTGEQSGVIDSYDVGFVLNNLGSTDPNKLKIGDLNFDGVIDTQDRSLIIQSLNVKYDDL